MHAVSAERIFLSSGKKKPRILIASYRFSPSVGGMEAVAKLLADRIWESGYAVSAVTDTPGSGGEELSYPVLRQPSLLALWEAVRAADLVVVNHPSLRVSWPLLLQRKPYVVIVHCWVSCSGFPGAIRRPLFRKASACVAISRAIERHLPVRARILPSPYDERTFFLDGSVPRTRDLFFVGRMHGGKGPVDLVEAMGLLKKKGILPTASFAGDGPARAEVEARVHELGLEGQTLIHGSCDPARVAALMREHRILVIPSVWEEPFGIVALEGIACGCALIATTGGGLPEAMGPCGLGYPNGDVPELARKIEELLRRPELVDRLRVAAEEHLARHTGSAIVARYLEIFHEILENG